MLLRFLFLTPPHFVCYLMSPFKFAQSLLSFEIQNGGKNEITVRIYRKKHVIWDTMLRRNSWIFQVGILAYFYLINGLAQSASSAQSARLARSAVLSWPCNDGHCYLEIFAKYIKLIKPNNIDYFFCIKSIRMFIYTT